MELRFLNPEHHYGFHCAKFPSLLETVKNVLPYPINAFQIFLGSPKSFTTPTCNLSDALVSAKILKSHDIKLYVHSCLLHNLCGTVNHSEDPKFAMALERTTKGMTAELDIVALLGGKGVVVHPNSCKDLDKGIATASKTIQACLTRDTEFAEMASSVLGITIDEFKKKRRVILENCAGEGTKRGKTLSELNSMIQGVDEKYRSQVKVCIDTAHAYGAGIYDFGKIDDINRFYSDFDSEIGLEHLEVFHLNDSRKSESKASNAFYGSRKDRHESLGHGWIFENKPESLKSFFLEAMERGISIIGESPSCLESGVETGGMYDVNHIIEILSETDHPIYFC